MGAGGCGVGAGGGTENLPTNVRYKIVREFLILIPLYFGDRNGLVDFRVETEISLYSIMFNVINQQNISFFVFDFDFFKKNPENGFLALPS
jgi:hypothetical protein